MQEEFLTQEEIELLSKAELIELEELSKSCPRCGGKSANPSNPSGRCRKHLNKLARDKKTPGHWQRSQTKFDDAKRRENGKNGTASKKSKGRASSRKDFVKRFQNDEKKTGTKLSPDRIKNDRGYESKNVRNIPEKLNRGRHKVDSKKLAAWKKRLKKYNLELDDFMTLLRSKALESGNEALEKTLNMLDIERVLEKLELKTDLVENVVKTTPEREDVLDKVITQLELARKTINNMPE
jgi:hypothetical protein